MGFYEFELDESIESELQKYLSKHNITFNQFIFGSLEVLKFEVKDVKELWKKQKDILVN